MTLEKTLRQQLNKTEPGGFHVSSDGWNVTVHTEKQDSLSCALSQLAIDKNAPVKEDLRAWATRVSDTASGLMETLCLVELDAPLGKAILRSATPTVQDGKALYYELVLTRTDLSAAVLRRYAGDLTNGGKRRAVPFVLTHDAVVKLVADIVGGR